jgi:hypothetical protein
MTFAWSGLGSSNAVQDKANSQASFHRWCGAPLSFPAGWLRRSNTWKQPPRAVPRRAFHMAHGEDQTKTLSTLDSRLSMVRARRFTHQEQFVQRTTWKIHHRTENREGATFGPPGYGKSNRIPAIEQGAKLKYGVMYWPVEE